MRNFGEALRRGGLGAMVALLMVGLTACSGSDEEEPAVSATPPEPEKVLMQSVTAIDFGRAYDAVVISVEGLAPGLGYQSPELRNHAGGARSQDGFAQFDFVAIPPDEDVAKTLPQAGSANALRIRADRELPGAVLQGLRGVRVFAVGGVATRPF